VLGIVSPAVLLSDDVFDMESQSGVFLKQSAVLATRAGSLPHELRRGGVHQAALPLARKARASAFRTPRRVFARTMDSSSACSSGVKTPAEHLSANSS